MAQFCSVCGEGNQCICDDSDFDEELKACGCAVTDQCECCQRCGQRGLYWVKECMEHCDACKHSGRSGACTCSRNADERAEAQAHARIMDKEVDRAVTIHVDTTRAEKRKATRDARDRDERAKEARRSARAEETSAREERVEREQQAAMAVARLRKKKAKARAHARAARAASNRRADAAEERRRQGLVQVAMEGLRQQGHSVSGVRNNMRAEKEAREIQEQQNMSDGVHKEAKEAKETVDLWNSSDEPTAQAPRVPSGRTTNPYAPQRRTRDPETKAQRARRLEAWRLDDERDIDQERKRAAMNRPKKWGLYGGWGR